MKAFINWILSFFKRKEKTVITIPTFGVEYKKGDTVIITSLCGEKTYLVTGKKNKYVYIVEEIKKNRFEITSKRNKENEEYYEIESVIEYDKNLSESCNSDILWECSFNRIIYDRDIAYKLFNYLKWKFPDAIVSRE